MCAAHIDVEQSESYFGWGAPTVPAEFEALKERVGAKQSQDTDPNAWYAYDVTRERGEVLAKAFDKSLWDQPFEITVSAIKNAFSAGADFDPANETVLTTKKADRLLFADKDALDKGKLRDMGLRYGRVDKAKDEEVESDPYSLVPGDYQVTYDSLIAANTDITGITINMHDVAPEIPKKAIVDGFVALRLQAAFPRVKRNKKTKKQSLDDGEPMNGAAVFAKSQIVIVHVGEEGTRQYYYPRPETPGPFADEDEKLNPFFVRARRDAENLYGEKIASSSSNYYTKRVEDLKYAEHAVYYGLNFTPKLVQRGAGKDNVTMRDITIQLRFESKKRDTRNILDVFSG